MTKPLERPHCDLIVAGSLHLDIMVEAPTLPQIDETKIGSQWGMKCGGKGGNQAVMAAKTGLNVAMIGAVGQDDFGSRLISGLESAGVNRREIRIDERYGSGMSVAILQDDGEYGAVVVSGANRHLDPQTACDAWHRLNGAQGLVLQNEIPDDVNIALAETAVAAGAFVVVNAAPYRPLPARLLAATNVLVLNRIEASQMRHEEIKTRAEAMAAFSPSRHSQLFDVIVTLGGQGLVVAAAGCDPVAIEPIPVTLVSAHGAGDCFVGVLSAALAKGFDILGAAHKANHYAAQYVSSAEQVRNNLRFDLS
jgi:ribokinase